jgi:hypothetical protein
VAERHQTSLVPVHPNLLPQRAGVLDARVHI